MNKYRRDTRAVREFNAKTAMRLIVMAAILVVVYMITQTPIITNSIAMNQMENSNDWFVAMTVYQKFANAAGLFGKVLVAVTFGFIGWDGYKLAKTLDKPEIEIETENENEKEN